MESFKELNDDGSKNDGFQSRLVFRSLLIRNCLLNPLNRNETGRHYTTVRINTIRNG